MAAKGPKAIQLMLQNLGVAPRDHNDAAPEEDLDGAKHIAQKGRGPTMTRAPGTRRAVRALASPGPGPAQKARPTTAAKDESSQCQMMVTKSNRLIEAGYRVTLAEQRVLLAILTQINTHPSAPPINGDTPFELTAGGFADLFQTERNQAYEQLKDASEKLGERWVVIDAPDPDNPALSKTKTRWVQRFDYLPTQGRIRVYLANAIIPYVSSLAGAFTRYRIQSIVGLTSVYAIRLYELLIQWQSQGEREVTVDWLRDRFQLGDAYPSNYELQRRVIRPAVEQVSAHTNISVTYTPRQVGRSVVAFQFRFNLKAAQVPAPAPPTERTPNRALTRAEIEAVARPGETWEDAARRLTASRR
jgi:hypothetical protein